MFWYVLSFKAKGNTIDYLQRGLSNPLRISIKDANDQMLNSLIQDVKETRTQLMQFGQKIEKEIVQNSSIKNELHSVNLKLEKQIEETKSQLKTLCEGLYVNIDYKTTTNALLQ